MTSCAFGFCGAHVMCPAIPKPDGACSQLMACCTLQGEGAGGCLEVARLIANVAGETSCISALGDWDVVSHMHVPCNTETAWNEAGPTAPPAASCRASRVRRRQIAAMDYASARRARRYSRLPVVANRAWPRPNRRSCRRRRLHERRCVRRRPMRDAHAAAHGLSEGILHWALLRGCYVRRGRCLPAAARRERSGPLQACESDADCPRDHYRCTRSATACAF